MNEDLDIDYNDQFFQAFRCGFVLGAQHGIGVIPDKDLWLAFLNFLEEGDDQ